jgi:hypothetical protein
MTTKPKKRSEDGFKLETQFVKTPTKALPPIVVEAIEMFDGRLVLNPPSKHLTRLETP